MHGRLDTSDLPDRRVVFHLRFTDDPQPFWLVIEDHRPSVCLTDPGYDVDVTITSDVSSLYEVWLGRLPVRRALRQGRLGFEGPTALTRRMPSVFRLSPIAETVVAATAQ
jgi:putative sterol carrier protein